MPCSCRRCIAVTGWFSVSAGRELFPRHTTPCTPLPATLNPPAHQRHALAIAVRATCCKVCIPQWLYARALQGFDPAACTEFVSLVWLTLMLSPRSVKRWATSEAHPASRYDVINAQCVASPSPLCTKSVNAARTGASSQGQAGVHDRHSDLVVILKKNASTPAAVNDA